MKLGVHKGPARGEEIPEDGPDELDETEWRTARLKLEGDALQHMGIGHGRARVGHILLMPQLQRMHVAVPHQMHEQVVGIDDTAGGEGQAAPGADPEDAQAFRGRSGVLSHGIPYLADDSGKEVL